MEPLPYKREMDIATDADMQALDALRSTPSSLKFEIEDLSNRIKDLIVMRIESLLILLFSKRAKLFELRDKHMLFSTQVLIEALDLEIQKLQKLQA